MNAFRLIGITPENPVTEESDLIVSALESGALWRIYLRHPSLSYDAMRRLVSAVPAGLRPRISVADARLAQEFGCGLHLRSNQYAVPEGFTGLLSASCHSFDDIEKRRNCDYVFLSPIFNSISKHGYCSAFSIDNEDFKFQLAKYPNVFALGGVTPDKFDTLKRAGFTGAALLGALSWDDRDAFNTSVNLCYNSLRTL